MINPTNAAIAATPSPLARPMATPNANMIGRLSKIIPPAPVIIVATCWTMPFFMNGK